MECVFKKGEELEEIKVGYREKKKFLTDIVVMAYGSPLLFVCHT